MIFYVDDLSCADTSVRMMERDPNSAHNFICYDRSFTEAGSIKNKL
jgi:hypothetical protein